MRSGANLVHRHRLEHIVAGNPQALHRIRQLDRHLETARARREAGDAAPPPVVYTRDSRPPSATPWPGSRRRSTPTAISSPRALTSPPSRMLPTSPGIPFRFFAARPFRLQILRKRRVPTDKRGSRQDAILQDVHVGDFVTDVHETHDALHRVG